MRAEQLGGGLVVMQTADFRFGTDAILLAAFGEPHKSGERVCDLGTGCGIIPFLLQNRAHPPKCTVGVDLQAEAIALCQAANAENRLETVSFLQADWYVPDSIGARGSFDRVVCNPPYFPAGNGRQNESEARAIARHAKADTLDAVCAAADYLLKFGGKLCMCHRPQYLADVFAAMQTCGLQPKRLQVVQEAADTAPQLVLVEAVKGGKSGLIFEKPWLLSDADTHAYIYGKYQNGERYE